MTGPGRLGKGPRGADASATPDLPTTGAGLRAGARFASDQACVRAAAPGRAAQRFMAPSDTAEANDVRAAASPTRGGSRLSAPCTGDRLLHNCSL